MKNNTNNINRVEQLASIQSQALELFARKNADYGDAFAKYGLIGVLMRIEDKIQRCISITKNGINLVSDEGLKDTLLDLHNYSAMATMLYDEGQLNLEEIVEKPKLSRDSPINSEEQNSNSKFVDEFMNSVTNKLNLHDQQKEYEWVLNNSQCREQVNNHLRPFHDLNFNIKHDNEK